jgi:hypothetical protein
MLDSHDRSGFAIDWDRRPATAVAGPPAPAFPSLTGRHVALRPITPGDYGSLQIMETAGEVGARWRFRGQTPSPEAWLANLWQGVLTQSLVQPLDSDRPIGLVVAYRASMQDRHVYVAATRFELERPSLPMMLGVSLFLRHLFEMWAFRAVYMEVPEYNLDQFGSSVGRAFVEEARLSDYYETGGRSWDQIILAMTRERFERHIQPIVRYEMHEPAPRRVRLRLPGVNA